MNVLKSGFGSFMRVKVDKYARTKMTLDLGLRHQSWDLI
jgi:hypothetical protein